MIDLIFRNLLFYSAQVAILIAAAGIALAVLRLNAAPRLIGLHFLLACCLVLPFAQRWPPQAAAHITVRTLPLGYTTSAAVQPVSGFRLSGAEIILAIIAAGICIRLALLLLGMVRLWRYRAGSRLVADAFAEEKRRIGIDARVYACEDVPGPVTFGLFRPAILLPSRWLDERAVAYHELIHVRRHDWAFTIAEELVRALLWFHPAIWWLIGRIQLAREERVDSEVVRLMESREQYLEALLAIAEARCATDLAPAPLFLKKRHLRQRIAALLNEVNMSQIRIRFSLAGFAALLACSAWMATRSFPLYAAPQSVIDSAGVTVDQDESKLLHRAPVAYPKEALDKHIQGAVTLELSLNERGEVVDAKVLSGPMELRRAAIESALKWHYDRESGVPAKVQVTINFVLPAQQPVLPAKLPPLPAPSATTITRIDSSRLPSALGAKVAGRLPVHIGDQADASRLEQMVAALSQIDEHLHAGVIPDRGGDGSTIVLSLDNQSQLKPAESTPQRIRVGGNVQQLNLVYKVAPVYPSLAKQARIQGTVRFTAVIGKDGHIINLELVGGHPLLVEAAREAVQQWVYRPTLLNGNPVEVVTQIDINFTLSENPPAQAPAPNAQQ